MSNNKREGRIEPMTHSQKQDLLDCLSEEVYTELFAPPVIDLTTPPPSPPKPKKETNKRKRDPSPEPIFITAKQLHQEEQRLLWLPRSVVSTFDKLHSEYSYRKIHLAYDFYKKLTPSEKRELTDFFLDVHDLDIRQHTLHSILSKILYDLDFFLSGLWKEQ